MQAVTIISNPSCAWNLRHPGRFRQAAEALSAKMPVFFHETRDRDALRAALRQAAGRREEAIVLMGGDGTVSAALSAIRAENLFEAEPSFALLRGGKGNVVHENAGVRGRPDRALMRILRCLARRETPAPRRQMQEARLPSLDITWPGGAAESGFTLCGAGLARLLYARRTEKRAEWLAAMAASLYRIGAQRPGLAPLFAPVPVQYSFDNSFWRELDALFIIASGLARLPLGLRGQAMEGAAFHVSGLSYPYRHAFRHFPSFRRGQVVPDGLSGYFRVGVPEKLFIKSESGWVLDGEFHNIRGVAEIRIAAGKPVRFLQLP